jgi:two-component system OmpR family response regulator/two-component system response regulator RstA
VLLVDDDPRRAAAAASPLEKHGFRVETVGSDVDIAAKLTSDPIDLVVLVAPGAGEAGAQCCRSVRANFDGPLIVVIRDARERELGILFGADDCIHHSAGSFALLARIQARSSARPTHRRLFVGRLVLDESYRRATVAGKPMALSDTEFCLLRLLAHRQGRMVPREDLERTLEGIAPELARRGLDQRMTRLKNKLGRAALELRVVGGGYSLEPDQAVRAAE